MISVTSEDIRSGCPSKTESCAIARAALRHFGEMFPGEFIRVFVDTGALVMVGFPTRKTYCYTTPDPAVDFINAFDNGGRSELEPQTFLFPFDSA